jgi:acetyl esterase/lipase
MFRPATFSNSRSSIGMVHPLLRAGLLSLSLLALPASLQAQTKAAPKPTEPPPLIETKDIAVENDVVFGMGGTHELHAEIAYPKNATGPMPAIIHIHGGGWVHGSWKGSPVMRLAKGGYFAASIEYRLSNVAKWPAQIQDCKLAVRWLRANAVKFNIDPNRIGVLGGSAGGHLVACLGTMADVKEDEGDGGYPGVSSAVQAVVDYFGPTDLTRPEIGNPGLTNLGVGLFGVPYAQNPGLWKSGSPFYYVAAGDPPMLIVQGDADTTVPPAQSIVFADALAKAGVPHQLLIVKNAGHGFKAKPGTKIDPPWSGIDKATMDFFAKYLGTAQTPPSP